MANESIGALLLKNTSLSENQVGEMLSLSGPTGEKLLDILTAKGISNVDELLKQLCVLLNVEFMKDIPVNDISVEQVRNIPINYAKQYEVLPFN